MSGADTLTPPLLMLAVGAIGGGLLLFAAIRLMLSGGDAQDRRRTARMQALAGASADAAIHTLIARPAPVTWGRRLPLVGDLSRTLAQAGLDLSVTAFCLGCLAAAVAGFALGTFAVYPLAGFAAAVCAGGILPVGAVNMLRRKRISLLTQQLPDALDLMVRGLRVGHPVAATMGNVARTMHDPIGTEFRIMVDQIQAGDYLTDAFADMAQRMDQEDLEYLSVSISIQHGTGGNLGDILSVLSRVIRDRLMMRRRVTAISSEGRLSAWLLSALPVGIFVVMSVTSPEYYGGISDDPMYRPIVAIIVALLVANALALCKLVTFEI